MLLIKIDNKKRKDFEELFIARIDSFYTIALAFTHSAQDAQDLVQDTALRAFRYFNRYKSGTNFNAWAIKIMRNIYINQYRKRKKEPARIDFSVAENFIPSPEIAGFGEEIFSERLQAIIDNLSEELRVRLILFFVEEFSYKEIAQVLDIPVGTVMSRLYTARQFLKKKLLKYQKREKNGLQ